MSAFHFRLARLKRLREIDEQLARERFLGADRRALDGEHAAELAARSRSAALDDVRRLQSTTPVDARALVAASAFLERCIELLHARTLAAVRLRAEAEAERATWTARRTELKGLERLEDRDRDAWRLDQARRDARVLDEVAGLRADAQRRRQASRETPSVSMKDPG
jgi:flagellar export protein FliJ